MDQIACVDLLCSLRFFVSPLVAGVSLSDFGLVPLTHFLLVTLTDFLLVMWAVSDF